MCERLVLPDGSVAIVCGTRSHARCYYCAKEGRRGLADIECDGPPPAGAKRKTCDRRCCRAHAKRIGPNRDLCIDCARAAAKGPVIQTLWE